MRKRKQKTTVARRPAGQLLQERSVETPARRSLIAPGIKARLRSLLGSLAKYFAMLVLLAGAAIYGIAQYSQGAAMEQLATTVESNTPEAWAALCDYRAVQASIAAWTMAGMEERMGNVPEPIRMQGREQARRTMEGIITPKATVDLIARVYGGTPQERRRHFEELRQGNRRSARVVSVGLTRMRVQWAVRPDSAEVITAVLDRKGFSSWRITDLVLPKNMISMGPTP